MRLCAQAGKPQRTTEEWRPEPLLCKRFNAPDPFKGRPQLLQAHTHFKFDALALPDTDAANVPTLAASNAPPAAVPQVGCWVFTKVCAVSACWQPTLALPGLPETHWVGAERLSLSRKALPSMVAIQLHCPIYGAACHMHYVHTDHLSPASSGRRFLRCSGLPTSPSSVADASLPLQDGT